MYCNVIPIIQFRETWKDLEVLLFSANNSIQYYSFELFKCQTVLFDPKIRPYQVQPLWIKVNLGVMAMKGYSSFPKAPSDRNI